MWERFLNSEIYILCSSKEDIRSFLSECDQRDIGWYGGGEKILASKNRTFNKHHRGDVYFQFSVGHIWSVPEYVKNLSDKEVIQYGGVAQSG